MDELYYHCFLHSTAEQHFNHHPRTPVIFTHTNDVNISYDYHNTIIEAWGIGANALKLYLPNILLFNHIGPRKGENKKIHSGKRMKNYRIFYLKKENKSVAFMTILRANRQFSLLYDAWLNKSESIH